MTEYRFGDIERIFIQDEVYGVPMLYLTRLHLGRLFLHIFTRGDMDRCPHNHPWAFWTFPLTTYYEEVWKVIDGVAKCIIPVRKVQRFRFHFRSTDHIHRVLHPAPGKKIITLVWHHPKGQAWGFWRDDKWIHHRDYFEE